MPGHFNVTPLQANLLLRAFDKQLAFCNQHSEIVSDEINQIVLWRAELIEIMEGNKNA